jgi:ankyrin repeat protein
MFSKTKMVKHLLKPPMNADPTRRDGSGRSALQLAVTITMKTKIFDLLLAHPKVKVDDVDGKGQTAVHFAASASNVIAVQKLLENRADPNIADKNGVTPLHLAAKNKDTTELIDIILETGQCNINGVDDDGRTPLHYAIERPDRVVTINALRLIKMGADPGIADKNGVTPLHLAARNAESMDLIDELLLNTGAVYVNCVDKQGRTPLDSARNNKQHGLGQRIIDRLKESGSKEG